MPDTITTRLVAACLGIIGITGVGLLAWLVYNHADASGLAVVAGATGPAIGALSALLASTRTTQTDKG